MDVMFYFAKKYTTEILDLKPRDNLVLTGGPVDGRFGNTNTIKIETV